MKKITNSLAEAINTDYLSRVLVNVNSIPTFNETLHHIAIIHNLVKGQMLTHHMTQYDKQNKDRVYIRLYEGNWGGVGKLKVVEFCHGEYMEHGYSGEEDTPGYMSTGARYFPVDQIDDAVLYFVTTFTDANSPFVTGDININIKDWNLDSIRKYYDENPDLVDQIDGLFKEVGIE